MKIGIKKTVEVDCKILKLQVKCADQCSIQVIDDSGEKIHDHDGYVPSFFPEQHYGDYIMLDIEIETGRILNWKPPTAPVLRAFIDGGDE